jgi:hypothetical protein
MTNLENVEDEVFNATYPSFLDSIPCYLPFIGPIRYCLAPPNVDALYHPLRNSYVQVRDLYLKIRSQITSTDLQESPAPLTHWTQLRQKIQEWTPQAEKAFALFQKDKEIVQKAFNHSFTQIHHTFWGSALTVALLTNAIAVNSLSCVTGVFFISLYSLIAVTSQKKLKELNEENSELMKCSKTFYRLRHLKNYDNTVIQSHLEALQHPISIPKIAEMGG